MKIIPIPRKQGLLLPQALDMIQQGFICMPNVAIRTGGPGAGGTIAVPGQSPAPLSPVEHVDLWVGGEQFAQIPVPQIAQLLYETSQETFDGPAEMLEAIVKIVFRMSLLEFIAKVEKMDAGTESDNPAADKSGG